MSQIVLPLTGLEHILNHTLISCSPQTANCLIQIRRVPVLVLLAAWWATPSIQGLAHWSVQRQLCMKGLRASGWRTCCAQGVWFREGRMTGEMGGEEYFKAPHPANWPMVHWGMRREEIIMCYCGALVLGKEPLGTALMAKTLKLSSRTPVIL